MELQPQVLEKLTALGFSEKEAKVYLACLILGTAKMTDIARSAELKRPTTYLIIDQLTKKNLISKIQKGKIDFYKPEDPQEILNATLEKTHTIQSLLPDLRALSKTKNRANITLYEGKQQMAHLHELLFRSPELYSLVYLDEYWKLFGEEHNRHLYEILKRHSGFVRLLVPKKKKVIEYLQKKYRAGLQEVHFLPDHFSMTNKVSFVLTGKLVVFISYGSITATVIEDIDIHNFHTQLWHGLWNQSEPFESLGT